MLPIPVSAPSPDLTSSKCPQGQLPSASQDLVSKKRPGSPLMKSSTGSIRKLDNSTDFQEDNEDVQMKGVPQTTPPSIENQDGCRSNNTSAISMAAVKREPSPESQPIRENQSDGQSAREPHKQDVILERKPPQLPSPRISSIHTQYSTSSAHVERLTRELLTAQREIAAFQAREQTILSQLGASGIVSKAAVTERDTLAVSELKALLRMSEDDVIYERERRLRAEQRLRDVERECKHPFVVPALMQALFNISELTDAVD
ncbi:hypothetical protein BJ138DRAFT_55540 [Hygrophoropsis aurantiaca]|uniref:Uncharacterized protein n=1 Tax=Hygrophoropsis aurantiaca TaxID=72124 RepID=A0ACB8AQG1_9AGAM|nr:hypothetical protein BJ138DRAFT_55540 [Hygrophoropsis aurantiaca]